MSAVWCVIPGVKAAIQTGVIDEQHIGIHGHSWGGYQTAFLITQTDMFKAARGGSTADGYDQYVRYDLLERGDRGYVDLRGFPGGGSRRRPLG